MNLIPAFRESVFDHPITGITSDLLEVGIDSVLTEGPLRDIPIFNVVLGTAKVIQNVRDRNMLKNTAIFISALQSEQIDQKKLQKYKQHLENPGIAEKELGRVLILLDRFIDSIKGRLLAKIYRKYVEQEYDWQCFCELSDILDRLILEDISYIQENSTSLTEEQTNDIIAMPYNIKRLESVGLVSIGGDYVKFGQLVWQQRQVRVDLTKNGTIFLNTILSMGNWEFTKYKRKDNL